MWILNPFLPCENHELSLLNEIQLLELSSDKLLEQSKNLNQFWISLRNEYPNLYEEAIKKLVPFATTYLCEFGFSTLTTIKTKPRNKLDVEPMMRISLTNSIEAHIDSLVKQHQDQGSH
ncbi:protein FAM200A-like [Metopolophium dirhodum]|uniref:protein FAM200A-like n=1 Tax=Metopolophium dirhodum TaxID=44670 RepID=UPI00298F6869|nr:protein FAM200A-like [Metopolophium dirhodum]